MSSRDKPRDQHRRANSSDFLSGPSARENTDYPFQRETSQERRGSISSTLAEPLPPRRLPQIQLPPLNRDLAAYRTQLSRTCPFLHQHPFNSGLPSSQTGLRKFFAKPDDITCPTIPGPSMRTQAPPLSPQYPSSSGRSLGPISSSQGLSSDRWTGSSTSTHPYGTMHQRYQGTSKDLYNETYQEPRPNASPFGPGVNHYNQGFDKPPLKNDGRDTICSFTDSDTDQEDPYRCKKCHRKCKSKASYMKHKSMMCTHKLGPLTRGCHYCEKRFTYAGYLSKHEVECAKNPGSLNHARKQQG